MKNPFSSYSGKQMDFILQRSWPLLLISGKNILHAKHDTKAEYLLEVSIVFVFLIVTAFAFGLLLFVFFSVVLMGFLSVRWRKILKGTDIKQ